jgi:hypothetical protein
VHSFGEGSLGKFFVGFMALTLVLSFNLLFSRLDLLKSRKELDSFVRHAQPGVDPRSRPGRSDSRRAHRVRRSTGDLRVWR